MLDEDRRIASLSAEAAAWFGASKAELIGADARELLPFTSPIFAAIESCFATDKPAKVRFRSDFHPDKMVEARVRPEGAGVLVCWSARRFQPRGGRASERPAEQPPRRPSDDDFEFTLDRSWRIAAITKSAAAWAGSTVDDLLGREGQLINPAATKLLAAPIDAALLRGAASTLEQPSTHVPGRWVRIDVEPVADGARVRFEDITSHVDGDEGEPAAENAAEIVLLDSTGLIVSANAAWRAGIVGMGLELSDVGIGAPYVEVAKAVVPNTDKNAFRDRLNDLLSGRVLKLEATFSQDTPAGQRRRQVQIAPIRIGEATYFLAVHEDLTERAKVLAALHDTSDRLLSAQEKERQRIAIELHDSMSQHLAGLTLGLTNLRRRIGQDASARSLIDSMSALTQQAVHETRVLSYLMNASGEDREGLEAAVRRFVRGFGRRAGLEAVIETQGPVNSVGAAVHHAVFRVIQEALSNVHRHAQASSVQVSLESRAGVLTARIADDGRGFRRSAESAAPLGVGIVGMRIRIEQLGGTLQIDGGPRGTVVMATIPLPPAVGSAQATVA
jgi:signal transduction histidine kinase